MSEQERLKAAIEMLERILKRAKSEKRLTIGERALLIEVIRKTKGVAA